MAYTPRNVLVTGGAGFILKNLQPIQDAPNYKFVQGDITCEELVSHIISSNQIDTILHFAAQTHVDHSFGNSIEFTKNNILGTHVLLEAANAQKVKRFIHVSTDEVYGELARQDHGVIESSLLEPTNPYAATKAGAEHLVKSYYRSFNLPIIITRGNNVYGPHQYPEKIIPKFICLLHKNKPCCMHGDGSHRRSFLYVSDAVEAFDIILHSGKVGEIYNVGSDFEISNLELAKLLINKFGLDSQSRQLHEEQRQSTTQSSPGNRNSDSDSGSGSSSGSGSYNAGTNEGDGRYQHPYIEYCEDRAFNDLRYSINACKLHTLGWTPKVSFNEGIEHTIAWYGEHMKTHWDSDVELALVPHPVFSFKTTTTTTTKQCTQPMSTAGVLKNVTASAGSPATATNTATDSTPIYCNTHPAATT